MLWDGKCLCFDWLISANRPQKAKVWTQPQFYFIMFLRLCMAQPLKNELPWYMCIQ